MRGDIAFAAQPVDHCHRFTAINESADDDVKGVLLFVVNGIGWLSEALLQVIHHLARLAHIADGADFDAVFAARRFCPVACGSLVIARRGGKRAHELLANLEAHRAAGDLFSIAACAAAQHDETRRRTERNIGYVRHQGDANERAVVIILPVGIDAARARGALIARVICLISATGRSLTRRLLRENSKKIAAVEQ